MKIYVYPTDYGWFESLRAALPLRVNFWRRRTQRFKALKHGEPLLFKSKTPDTGIRGAGMIMGGAFFDEHVLATVAEVWDAFGERNGVSSFDQFLGRLHKMTGTPVDGLTEIGCILLTMPFFLPRELWVPVHDPKLANAVQGAHYDLDHDSAARALWDTVAGNIAGKETLATPSRPGDDYVPPRQVSELLLGHRLGAGHVVHPRLGQAEFRLSVISAYDGRCGVTGERVRPTLEAAHIMPFAKDGPSVVANGLALRADIHRLFDAGLVTVDPNYRFHVSPIVRTKFQNGREYYRFDGQPLTVVPSDEHQRPRREYLEWHNNYAFRP